MSKNYFYRLSGRKSAWADNVCRFLFLLGFFCYLGLGQAAATHFRYGNVSWRLVQSDPTRRTVEFKVTQAWQGSPAVGEAPFETTITFGDRRNQSFNAPATFVNAAENYFFAQTTFTHTYPSNGNYVAYMMSCCRIPGLVNNAGGSYYISTLVNIGTGNNSPVSTLSPIVNLPAGVANATFQVPANDPDGDPLTYSLATSADMANIAFTKPVGLTIDPVTGVVSFNTVGKAVGEMYNAVVKVSDGKTSILMDFLIKLTAPSSAPQFDYSVMPAKGYVYQVPPGRTISFPVRATDQDPTDVVTLQALGLPPGSTMSATLPTTGNPVQSTFSWTPGPNNLGTSVINFVAQDSAGTQTHSSVVIQVSMRPVFDVPPTPLAGSKIQIVPGTPVQYTVQASDPDPNDRVQLVAAQNLPATATLSAPLPTAAGRTSSTQLSWTPAVANWGKHTLVFTAADTYGERTDHSFSLVVNTPPTVVSSPATRVIAGQPYSYSVQVNDPDLAYGDVMKVLATTKPAWLTLVDNGNGTATLSGTPQAGDAGLHPVVLLAEDKHHHGYDQSLATQSYQLEVIDCKRSLASVPEILVAPTSNVYTGGSNTAFYLGYGPQSALLTASGGVRYSWSPTAGLSDPTSASPVFSTTAPGTFTYTVTLFNADGCSATKTVTLKVVDARCGNGGKNDKVLVCHNGHEICISANAVPAHLNNTSHDDTLGSCLDAAAKPNPGNEPNADNKFEVWPNPFTTSTSIRFRSLQTVPAQVQVYNSYGTFVTTLYDGVAQAGHFYSLTLEGKGLKEGVYLCQLVINGKIETQRIQLTK